MDPIQIPNIATSAAPALGAVVPGTGSVCLAFRGEDSANYYYSQFPFTSNNYIAGAQMTASPTVCVTSGDLGRVWAWKNKTGTGMQWAADGVAGVQGVPNHAHTVSSPLLLPVTQSIDPITGSPEMNLFTLFWQGDEFSSGNGEKQQLWSMSYQDGYGWGAPAQIPQASPVTSPAGCAGPNGYTVAWADSYGQVWISQSDGSGDAGAAWSIPIPCPVVSTATGLAICYFGDNLMVVWTAPGVGWLMYSLQTPGSDGEFTWTDPAILALERAVGVPAATVVNGTLYVAWRDFADNSISYLTYASQADLPVGSVFPSGWPMQISLVPMGHAFTGTLLIGEQANPANVIIDTGSSTLAVLASKYATASDGFLQATNTAQFDAYGAGGATGYWFGPVVQTMVQLPLWGLPVPSGVMSVGVSVAVAEDTSSEPPVFEAADGILGLAFPKLNSGYDFTEYLLKEGASPFTYPWPITAANAPTSQPAFSTFISSNSIPRVPVIPCLSQFVDQGILPNKFGLWVSRSLVSNRLIVPGADPSNYGVLVLGGGEEYFTTDVPVPYQIAEIVGDSFYNVSLISVQVGDNAPIPVLPGAPVGTGALSNAVLDSGTPGIIMEADLYVAVIDQMIAMVPNMLAIVNIWSLPPLAFNQNLNMDSWPTLQFVLAGPDGTQATLACTPNQYWQTDNPVAGEARFMLSGAAPPSGLQGLTTILGLTLMTGYYTIFDRSADGLGVVKFRPKPLYYT